jgi:hypothetical protein
MIERVQYVKMEKQDLGICVVRIVKAAIDGFFQGNKTYGLFDEIQRKTAGIGFS